MPIVSCASLPPIGRTTFTSAGKGLGGEGGGGREGGRREERVRMVIKKRGPGGGEGRKCTRFWEDKGRQEEEETTEKGKVEAGNE